MNTSSACSNEFDVGRCCLVAATVVALFSVTTASAQPGSLDMTFNAIALSPPSPQYGKVLALVVQADQRILVGGALTTTSEPSLRNLARLNPDGTVDATFQTGTGPNDIVTCIDLQPDGKLFIAGSFTEFNGVPRRGVARLLADGSLDETFDVGSGADSPGSGVTIVKAQPDGRALVAGTFTSFNGTAQANLARLLANGAVDNSFSVRMSSLFADFANITALALLPDGRIYVTGFSYPETPVIYGLARLLPSGGVDETFLPPSLAGSALIVQPDGKVLVGGSFSGAIARVHPDGRVDETFKTFLVSGGDYWVHVLALQPDGRILVAGDNFSEGNTPGVRPNETVVRIEADGAIDHSFAPGSSGITTYAGALAFQADGKILLGVYEAPTGPFLFRLNNELVPRLDLVSLGGAQLQLGWATNYVGYTLESAATLSAGSWTPATNVVTVVGGRFSTLVHATEERRFYRLRH